MKLLASIETSQVHLATDGITTKVENSKAVQRRPKLSRREHRELRDKTATVNIIRLNSGIAAQRTSETRTP